MQPNHMIDFKDGRGVTPLALRHQQLQHQQCTTIRSTTIDCNIRIEKEEVTAACRHAGSFSVVKESTTRSDEPLYTSLSRWSSFFINFDCDSWCPGEVAASEPTLLN